MPSFRTPVSAIVGSLLVLVAALLFLPLPVDAPSAPGRALRDTLHFPLFAFLLAAVHAMLLRLRPAAKGRSLVWAILLTTGIAATSEWAQSLTATRMPCWRDLLINLLGIAAASATIIGAWLRGTRWFVAGLLSVAGVWVLSLWLVTRSWVSVREAGLRQAAAFPCLGNFEEKWETIVWIPQGADGPRSTKATISRSYPTRGSQSLKVEARGSEWAGTRVLISSPLPWPPSQALWFDVFNPGESFELGIRVDGSDGRRYSAQRTIAPGPNQCRVLPSELFDGDRELTRSAPFRATTIVFHRGGSPATGTFFLDNVRLE